MRSPIRIGALPSFTACVYEETTVKFLSRTGTGVMPRVLSVSAFIYAGVVPQQPPTTRTPFFTSSQTSSEKSSAVTSNTVFPSTDLGSPALGLRMTGTEAFLSSSMATPRSCLGPSEQFAPRAAAPMPSSIAAIAAGEAPVISLPSSP